MKEYNQAVEAKAITVEQMIDHVINIAKEACEQEGVDYNEFISVLGKAMYEGDY